jgi:hypothetical protein
LQSLSQELRESTIQGRVFVDSAVEFGVPDSGVVDFATIDAILISNYSTMCVRGRFVNM